MFRENEISKHEAAIVGISDLELIRICRLLKEHPLWIMQTVYCKAVKRWYRKGVSREELKSAV
ncbi:hypothetical protein ACFL5V_13610 [Fibrobacterota bacterium]